MSSEFFVKHEGGDIYIARGVIKITFCTWKVILTWKGRSPVWVLRCVERCVELEKLLLH